MHHVCPVSWVTYVTYPMQVLAVSGDTSIRAPVTVHVTRQQEELRRVEEEGSGRGEEIGGVLEVLYLTVPYTVLH